MGYSPFDMNIAEIATNSVIRPLWTLEKLDSEEEMLKWQNNTYEVEIDRATAYREQARKHLALFLGRFYEDQTSTGKAHFAEASVAGLGVTPMRVSKVVVNHLAKAVKQRINRVTRSKPDITVEPANAEYSDRISAKIIKYWLDYEFYENDIEKLDAEALLACYIMGEAYMAVLWDPEGGDVAPDWAAEEKLAKSQKRPPRLQVHDDEGKPVFGDDGKPLYIEKEVHVGDVKFKATNPLNTLVQSTGNFDTAEYVFFEDYLDLDEVKALWPEKADLIKIDSTTDPTYAKWRTVTGIDHSPANGKILVRYFYHRPNKFLAGGRFVVSTQGAILENRPYPKGQKGLPLVRITDQDVPGEQRGVSFFIYGKVLNASINDFTSMMRTNSIMLAHPRWVVPRGSLVKKDALGNAITQIEYQGPVPPRIEAPPPMSQEIGQIRNALRTDFQEIMGSSDMEGGIQPPAARSAIEVETLEEQADQRASTSLRKHAAFIKGIAEKGVNLASAHYEEDDDRLIPVVGRDNRYLLKEFHPKHLSKSFNFRISSGGAMPVGKQAKIQAIVEMKKAFPNLLPDPQVAEMLEFGDKDRYFDAITTSVKAAEAENEALLGEEELEEPATFEDHITHWTIHMRDVQNRGFKTATPPEVQEKFLQHLRATEYLMLLTARKNPAYAVELVKLVQFPAFFELSSEDRMLLDAARTGNPLTLVQIEQLYTTGAVVQANAAPPPAGGPAGVPNKNNPLYNNLTSGVAANMPTTAPAPASTPPGGVTPSPGG